MARYCHDQHSGRPYQPLKTLQIHLPVPWPPLFPSVPNLLFCQFTHPSWKIFPPWTCRGVRQRLCRFPQGSVTRGPHSNGAVFLSSILWVYENKFTQVDYSVALARHTVPWYLGNPPIWIICTEVPSCCCGYLLPQYSEEISAGRIHIHVENLPSLWLPCARGGRAIYSYLFSWGQHLYLYMDLLSFILQSWTVGHQPSYCGCPLHMDGEHQFPLAGVQPSKCWPPFAPLWWAHDTAPRRYTW